MNILQRIRRTWSWSVLLLAGGLVLPGGKAGAADGGWLDTWRTRNPVWRGAHVFLRGSAGVAELVSALPALEAAGLNALIVEVNFDFAFESHPELRGSPNPVTRTDAARLARSCRERGIRLIPMFNCLGHQSWAKRTFPLLTKYPEFDETPGQFPENQGIYCRSWCPQHPGVNAVVFPLLDELLNAFEADALHVGLDEVFLLASEHCPRCRGGDPAALFARAVNDLHAQLVDRRGVELLIWADRLLDGRATGLGEWEAAKNGTHPAIDLIPKDVILCDWHYEPLAKYPGKPTNYVSVPILIEKGFRVWPSGWKEVAAVTAFVDSASVQRKSSDRVLGYLATTWGAVKPEALAKWPPLVAGFERVRAW